MRFGRRFIIALGVAAVIYFFFSRPLGYPLTSPFTLTLMAVLLTGRAVQLRPRAALGTRGAHAAGRRRLMLAAGALPLASLWLLAIILGLERLASTPSSTVQPGEACQNQASDAVLPGYHPDEPAGPGSCR